MDNSPKLLGKGTFTWEELSSTGLDDPKSVILCALGNLVDKKKYPPYTIKQLESSCEELGYASPSTFQIQNELLLLEKNGLIDSTYASIRGSRAVSKKVYKRHSNE